jgi:MFS family permease
MKIFRTMEAQQRRNLLALFAAGLLFWSSLASMLPALPPYIEDMGGTTQQVGMVMGGFAIGLLMFRQRLGHLADQHSRKLVILIGTIVMAIAPLGYLFADSIAWLMAIRVFHGIGLAAFTTGYIALVTDLSPVGQRGELIGYMSLVTPLGMGLGPALGGLLEAQAGYTAFFLFSGGLGLLAFVCASQVREPERIQGAKSKTAKLTFKGFWQLLVSPRLRIPAVVLLLAGLAFGGVSTFAALYIRATNVDLNPGWFFTAVAIGSFGMRLIAGRASDRYGRGVFITGSLIGYGIALTLFSQAQTPQAFLLIGLIQGSGAGILLPLMIALISDRSGAHERGRVFSACIAGFDLGIAIAGPVWGTMAEPLGYPSIFLGAAGLIVLAVIIFTTQSSKTLSHSLRFAVGRERDIYVYREVES